MSDVVPMNPEKKIAGRSPQPGSPRRAADEVTAEPGGRYRITCRLQGLEEMWRGNPWRILEDDVEWMWLKWILPKKTRCVWFLGPANVSFCRESLCLASFWTMNGFVECVDICWCLFSIPFPWRSVYAAETGNLLVYVYFCRLKQIQGIQLQDLPLWGCQTGACALPSNCFWMLSCFSKSGGCFWERDRCWSWFSGNLPRSTKHAVFSQLISQLISQDRIHVISGQPWSVEGLGHWCSACGPFREWRTLLFWNREITEGSIWVWWKLRGWNCHLDELDELLKGLVDRWNWTVGRCSWDCEHSTLGGSSHGS